ncbi:MAG: RimK family alpha-L-glutamate ligase [Thermoprotei archaeon]|nr:MAG: RimK family alpha-L-glutamate ligase [Thermoprotei archaeon]RLE89985.1 MAG: RimK family alpha-L-glutamate ligase [Thermoprotei archaeon]
MRVGVIYSTPIPTTTNRLIIDELKRRNIETIPIPLQVLELKLGEGIFELSIGPEKLELDVALLRGLGAIISLDQYLVRVGILKSMEELGVKLINNLNAFLTSRSKLLTLLTLYKKGLPVPLTLVSENLRRLYEDSKAIKPIIVKPCMGSRGYGTTVAYDHDILFQIYRHLLSMGIVPLTQRYLDKPQRDIRVFIIGDEAVAAMYRISTKSWKTNIAQGARARPLKISEELSELAIRACRAVGLEYGGVDIAEENENYFILEVNGSPDFERLMQITKVNIPSLIVDYILNLARE